MDAATTPDWGHYLDHASTSPLRPAARDGIVRALDLAAGDPSRIHASGMVGRALVEDSRDRLAAALGARPREVVFTSGASESIAAVCWGAAQRGGPQVVPAVEHSAVRLSAAQHGPVHEIGCDRDGRVDPDAIRTALDADASISIVHLQWGNHEVGTTQPIEAVIAECRARGVLVHVDAAQAAGRVPIDFGALGADLVSVSGHKLGGPTGTGLLLVRRGVRLRPLIVGGEQERARRAGMENVMAVVGLTAAYESIDIAREAADQRRWSAELIDVLTTIEGVEVYGLGADRLPHIVCAGIADIEPQAVLLDLDRAGIRAHSGSACASEGLEPSPVLEAMGVDAHRSLRLSVGWTTTDDDIAAVARALPTVIGELRALRGAS